MELKFFKIPIEGEIWFILQTLLRMNFLKSFYDNDEVFDIYEHKAKERWNKPFRFDTHDINIDRMVITANKN
jgi:hypothetical protein